MTNYLTKVFRKTVPQLELGSVAYPVNDWTRLERFLIFADEGGSYNARKQDLTLERAEAVRRCLEQDALRTVSMIVGISESGRAPSNNPSLFALAMSASFGSEAARSASLAAVTRVVRTGADLLHFASFIDGMRGWGRGLRRAVARWYIAQPLEQVAYHVASSEQCSGWSHRDLLRMAHPKAEGERDALFRWLVKGRFDGKEPAEIEQGDLRLVGALEHVRRAESATEVANLIRVQGLTREMVPAEYLDRGEVWEALLERMPLRAMVQHLTTLAGLGLIAPNAESTERVAARLRSPWATRKSKLQPLAVLAALLTYKTGRDARGRHWTPSPDVVDALQTGFHLALGNAAQTGKRLYLAVDVSASMGWGQVAGVPGFTPRLAAAAMAMIVVHAERECYVAAFVDRNGGPIRQQYLGLSDTQMTPVDVAKCDSLADTCQKLDTLPFGATDCGLPMRDALDREMPVDTFVVLTDCETWYGRIHPVQALRQYREKTGIAAKLVVVGMAANGFRIADPEDAGMLDIIGFDAATPELIADFASS